MRHHALFAVFLIILSCVLTGCSLSLPPPSPQQLAQIFTKPFTCGFSGYDGTETPYCAALVRTDSGDTLTVYGDDANVVIADNGTGPCLLARGSTGTQALSLPLPDGYDCGAAAFLPLFSVLPDDTFSSSRGDGGIVVTNADGTYCAVFSEDGIPLRLTWNGRCAVIESFTAAAPAP